MLQRLLPSLERILLAGGMGLVLAVGAVYAEGWWANRVALDSFDAARRLPPDERSATPSTADLPITPTPARAEANASGDTDGLAQAVLTIPALSMRVPVFAGTGQQALNRGAGLVEGNALPGEAGNIAIAAHRDSHFRALKDVEVGHHIMLETLSGTQHFRVEETRIVDPLDTGVLAATDMPTLTLITCYPFYFIGHAPDRFVVRAVLQTPARARPAVSVERNAPPRPPETSTNGTNT